MHGRRQAGAWLGLPAVSERLRCARHGRAGDRSALASRRFSILLVLAVETPVGTSRRVSRIRPLIREMSIAKPL